MICKQDFVIFRFFHKLLKSTLKLHLVVRCLQFFETSKELISIFALFFRSIVARFELSSLSRTPYISEQTKNLRLVVLVGRLEDCLSLVHMECFVQ